MERVDRRNLAAALAGISGALEEKPTLVKPGYGTDATTIIQLAAQLIDERRLPVKVTRRGDGAWFEPDMPDAELAG